MVLQIHYLRSGYVDDFNFQFVNDIVLYHINSTMIIWLSMDTFIRLSLPFFDDYKKGL